MGIGASMPHPSSLKIMQENLEGYVAIARKVRDAQDAAMSRQMSNAFNGTGQVVSVMA